MATVIWRPDGTEGLNEGWKQWFCAEHYAPIDAMVKASAQASTDCMRCGQTVIDENAYHYLLAYVFVPGRDRQDGYYQVCNDCWQPLLRETKARSQLLPDRPLSGPTAERPPSTDPWAAFR
jgi:hypothetical protein